MSLRKVSLHRSWAAPKTIGFIGAASPTIWSAYIQAFEHKLRSLHWVNGNNLNIHYLWAHGRDRAAEFAKNFVDHGVDIIVTSGTGPTLAAKKATKTIPIVFATAGDPFNSGLTKKGTGSGGNVTGMSNGQSKFAVQRLGALRKTLPNVQKIALVGNYGSGNVPLEIEAVKPRASELDIETVPCDIRAPTDIVPKIKALQGKVDALYVCTDLFLTTYEVALNMAAVSAGLPTMHAFEEYAEAGGLMSYGPDVPAMFGHAAELVDRILRGEEPEGIAVEEPKTAKLVINLSTADALGVTIPKGARANAKLIR
jgi:putative ABC transport system substrate-binding protein